MKKLHYEKIGCHFECELAPNMTICLFPPTKNLVPKSLNNENWTLRLEENNKCVYTTELSSNLTENAVKEVAFDTIRLGLESTIETYVDLQKRLESITQ